MRNGVSRLNSSVLVVHTIHQSPLDLHTLVSKGRREQARSRRGRTRPVYGPPRSDGLAHRYPSAGTGRSGSADGSRKTQKRSYLLGSHLVGVLVGADAVHVHGVDGCCFSSGERMAGKRFP